jgi:hydrogenase maturation protease
MSREPVAALLVLAVGNPSRGDDALGPALLDALHAQGTDTAGDIELVTDFQLQVEHALDLQGRRAVLFVDAARPGTVAAADGIALTSLVPAAALPALSHALSASAVLHVAQRLGGPLPPAWQLAIEGEGFGLGEPIGAAAQARLAPALALALGWIAARRCEMTVPGPIGAVHA